MNCKEPADGIKVVFDGYWWKSGPPSGRNVLRETVYAWRRMFPQDDVHMVVARITSEEPDLPDGVYVHRSLIASHPWIALVSAPLWGWRLRANAVLTQNFSSFGSRSFAFVHDVLFQSNPEYFTTKEKLYLRLIPTLLRAGGKVFTSSVSEAGRIRKYNPMVGPVTSVGLGVSTDLLWAEPSRPRSIRSSKFVLSVGRLNARKNLATILEAAALSPDVTDYQPLVVIGEPEGVQSLPSAAVRASVERGEIIFMGFLPDRELAWCYANATALYFLSHDEGFGLPPLEAIAFNCPVVLSDIPVFREIYGETAHFVGPEDVESVSHNMSEQLRAAGTTRGEGVILNQELLVRYSWDRMVRLMREEMV